jgi:hypothetical protein
VSSELLYAYYEMFHEIEDGKIDVSLMKAIEQGLWSPKTATEYIERFIAMASGTMPFRFAEPEDRP